MSRKSFTLDKSKFSKIYGGSNFLKDLYLMESLTIENKNKHAHDLLLAILYGTNDQIRKGFKILIHHRFNLLGNRLDEVLKTFERCEKILEKD